MTFFFRYFFHLAYRASFYVKEKATNIYTGMWLLLLFAVATAQTCNDYTEYEPCRVLCLTNRNADLANCVSCYISAFDIGKGGIRQKCFDECVTFGMNSTQLAQCHIDEEIRMEKNRTIGMFVGIGIAGFAAFCVAALVVCEKVGKCREARQARKELQPKPVSSEPPVFPTGPLTPQIV